MLISWQISAHNQPRALVLIPILEILQMGPLCVFIPYPFVIFKMVICDTLTDIPPPILPPVSLPATCKVHPRVCSLPGEICLVLFFFIFPYLLSAGCGPAEALICDPHCLLQRETLMQCVPLPFSRLMKQAPAFP